MAKHKWYVVTTGRKVGIFNNWLETASYVKGVSGAVYKGFPTETQARREFEAALVRGDVETIRESSQPASNRNARPTENSPFSSPSPSPQPRSPAANGSPLTRRHNVTDRPADEFPRSSHRSTPVSRSASEPSPSARRFEIINSYFKNDSGPVGAEARVPFKKSAQASPPKGSSNVVSPNAASPSQSTRAIVKTPAWLAAYPQDAVRSQLLSPLSSTDLALQTFPADRAHGSVASSPRTRLSGHPVSPSVYRNKSPGQQSNSSIYLSPRPVHVRYEHDVDPRSPIMNRAQVLELSFVSSASFVRPSPSLHLEQLPHEGMRSSLLFQPSPSPLK